MTPTIVSYLKKQEQTHIINVSRLCFCVVLKFLYFHNYLKYLKELPVFSNPQLIIIEEKYFIFS